MLNGSIGSISSVDDLKINDKNKQSIQAVPGGQDIRWIDLTQPKSVWKTTAK